MKICFIVGAFPPMKCGIGDYTNLLGRELVKMGYEVTIITSRNAKYINEDNYKVKNIIDKWDNYAKDIIIRTVRESNADIVNIQYPSDEYKKGLFMNILPMILKKQCNVKVVETVHEYLNYTYKGKIRNLINYLYADNLIVVEKLYIDKIRSFLPIISKGIKISYIPISSNIPKSTLSKEELIKFKNTLVSNNEKLISYFGFINDLKGVETLLNSFKLFNERINSKLLIISELNLNNDYHKKIFNQIERLGLRQKVIVTGFNDNVDKIANYLVSSDVCVLPFRDGVSERNGSFLAALNQGIPIITTSKEDKISSNGVYYVKPNDDLSIVKYLNKLSDNKEQYERSSLSWESIAREYINVYSRLLK
ncbi:glycosyltransferase [Clostridium sp. CTA-7]